MSVPRWARIVLAVALAIVAITSYDVYVYVLRQQSALQTRPSPEPCPDVVELSQRSVRRTARAHQTIVGDLLQYDCDTESRLADLFTAVTRTETNTLGRAMLWVRYVQTTIASSMFPSIDADGTAIYHPLFLLEHSEMDCSQKARLLVDGFQAVGIPARVLQMRGHVSAEFYADGKWRLAEADLLSDGQFVADPSGRPASVDEILANPLLLANVQPNSDPASDVYALRQRLLWVFEAVVYPQSTLTTPYVIKKDASRLTVPRVNVLLWLNKQFIEEAALETRHHYGWNEYVFCHRSDANCSN
jgi:hypothetical protein